MKSNIAYMIPPKIKTNRLRGRIVAPEDKEDSAINLEAEKNSENLDAKTAFKNDDDKILLTDFAPGYKRMILRKEEAAESEVRHEEHLKRRKQFLNPEDVNQTKGNRGR